MSILFCLLGTTATIIGFKRGKTFDIAAAVLHFLAITAKFFELSTANVVPACIFVLIEAFSIGCCGAIIMNKLRTDMIRKEIEKLEAQRAEEMEKAQAEQQARSEAHRAEIEKLRKEQLNYEEQKNKFLGMLRWEEKVFIISGDSPEETKRKYEAGLNRIRSLQYEVGLHKTDEIRTEWKQEAGFLTFVIFYKQLVLQPKYTEEDYQTAYNAFRIWYANRQDETEA